MLDILERLENTAEAEYFKILQPDGRLKCACNKLFAADKGGGIISSNPYAMPVCGNCFNEWKKSMEDKMLNECTPCTPKKEAEVPGQMNYLEKTISQTRELITTLRSRLSMVLTPQPSREPETKTPTEEEIVPLATEIRHFRIQLQECNNDLRDMIDACQL